MYTGHALDTEGSITIGENHKFGIVGTKYESEMTMNFKNLKFLFKG